MNMEDKFEPLDKEEVLCFEYEPLGRYLSITNNNFSQFNFKKGQFSEIVMQKIGIGEPIKTNLFGKGIDCEVLRFGANNWQKGKFRIKMTVEFCPDEPELEETPETNQPESPLDDIRRMINQENQQGNS